MPPAVFPEKRTRSQLALPDEILQIPQGSPMKAAKTAFKSQAHSNGASSSPRPQSEDTDDELMLSPKKAVEESRKPSSSKRSVSPEPHDEYSRTPRSPSKGRDPKRIKRDALSEPPEANEMNIDLERTLQQRLTPSHSRHHSDPNTTTRRSGRKRSATTSKKPLSTVSASPPPTDYTPVISPKKGRAQSVPLFPSNYDMPRIDFRNPPPSPKRAQSPSRSPGKEKFRIELGSFPKFTSLPTIHDETSTAMDLLEEATSVDEERELPAVTSEPSIPTFQLNPATSESSIASKISVADLVPATPRTRLLDKLMPLSPLTPSPETPFPGRKLHSEDDRIQVDNKAGWGVNLINEFESSKLAFLKYSGGNPLTVPKPPALNSVTPIKPSRNSTMPPPASPTGYKKPIKGPPASTPREPVAGPSYIATAPKANAFDVLMKTPRGVTAQIAEKARKVIGRSKATEPPRAAPQPPPPQQHRDLSSQPKGKEKAVSVLGMVGTSGTLDKKANLKGKMKKKSAVKPTAIVLRADEEEENAEAEDVGVSVPSSSRIHEETSKPMERTEDVVMESPVGTEAPAAIPQEEPLVDTDVPMAEISESTIPEPVSLPQDAETLQPESPALPEEESSTDQRPPGFGPSVSMDNVIADLPQEVEGQPVEPAETSTTVASTKPGPSKLPQGKKRQPSSVAPADRVTRSLSKRKDKAPEPSQHANHKKAVASGSLKRTASAIVKKPIPTKRKPAPVETEPAEVEPLQPMDTDPAEPEPDLPPGSPMRTSSPAKTPNKSPAAFKTLVQDEDDGSTIFVRPAQLSLGRTPTKNKTPVKPASSPSPTKIARATSLFNKPTLTSLTRTFSSDSSGPSSAAGASLSTLSNALEKLRMPPPSRPNTSMGFSRDTEDDGDASKPTSKDDASLNRASTTFAKPDSLKRSVTVSGPYRKPGESSTSKNLVQKPLDMYMKVKESAGGAFRGTGRVGASGSRKTLFGIGGPARRTVSKKTSLPMVVGSPVKGGGSGAEDQSIMQESRDESEDSIIVGDKTGNDSNDSNIFMAPLNGSTGSLVLEDLEGGGGGEKGKAKEKSKNINASRRVSMLSHALSQSLSELPLAPPAPSTTNGKGLMGPPATPPSAHLKAGSSDNAATSSGGESSSPSQAGPSGTRTSSRIATKNAQVKATSPEAPVSAGRKSTDSTVAPTPPKHETLKILNDCKIFVDVKTDDGDEAGSLFVEMLEGIGAKIMTRAGQTCTHIVYKNGLMSTVTRYKLLRDPKPLVVAIGWVVECVEQRKHIDEANFIIDLDEVNMTGTNKRRRSILPKLFADLGPEATTPSEATEASGEADHSMDGSTSSITLEDDLAPLERARRRKSMVVGRP